MSYNYKDGNPEDVAKLFIKRMIKQTKKWRKEND